MAPAIAAVEVVEYRAEPHKAKLGDRLSRLFSVAVEATERGDGAQRKSVSCCATTWWL